jgi:transcriptional repressor NF-X1
MPCHAGNCGHCRVLISQPVPCPCGKTSLRPPVSCGTLAPECDNLCLK